MIKSNNLDRRDLVRELNNAMKGEKEEKEQTEIYHASTNSIEVINQVELDASQKEEKPVYTEEELFAMVREQRRKQD